MAPHSFNVINKSLNRNMFGQSVFLAYKKAWISAPQIRYLPSKLTFRYFPKKRNPKKKGKLTTIRMKILELLYRYPSEDHDDLPFPAEVSSFGLPMGAVIESWPKMASTTTNRHVIINSSLSDLKPTFNTFVLNVNDNVVVEKVYGACLIFYERFDSTCLSRHQLDMLLASGAGRMSSSSNADANGKIEQPSQLNLHSNKCLLILSRNPLFDTYRAFLDFLLRKYTSKLASGLTSSDFLPIER